MLRTGTLIAFSLPEAMFLRVLANIVRLAVVGGTEVSIEEGATCVSSSEGPVCCRRLKGTETEVDDLVWVLRVWLEDRRCIGTNEGSEMLNEEEEDVERRFNSGSSCPWYAEKDGFPRLPYPVSFDILLGILRVLCRWWCGVVLHTWRSLLRCMRPRNGF